MCTWSHGIRWYWFIVRLAVGAWQHPTMFLVFKPPLHKQLSCGEKVVDTPVLAGNTFSQKPLWDVLKWESSHNHPGALVNSSDGALGLAHVLLCGCRVTYQ